ncbi:DUF3578 domain-containing protein [Alphaproteobacteria bacterium]|nr:DUF3578 domain-containing protein [Alphaproteobacteria bacterium]
MLLDLRYILNQITTKYPSARKEPLKNHPFRKFIEIEVRNYLKNLIKNDFKNLIVKTSAQQGMWNIVPWMFFSNPIITKSARRGYYVNYSFSEDFKSLILHIGQGYDEIKDEYGSDWKLIRDIRANLIKDRLSSEISGQMQNPSLLKNFRIKKRDHAGSFFGKVYSTRNLPINHVLISDLFEMLNLYEHLIFLGGIGDTKVKLNSDKEISGKEEKKLRSHIRMEYEFVQRNKKIIDKIKSNSDLNCEACEFNFNKIYKNKPNYIEAHHIMPVSKMKLGEVKKITKKDIALLCSNCHRMIHKFGCPDISEFKKRLI